MWSSSGRDVHLEWDGSGGSRGIAEAIRAAIRAGRLGRGDQLPSTRTLASDLGVARGTVTRAYLQLADEGRLRIRQGAPTTVATAGGSPDPDPPDAPGSTTARWRLVPGLPDLSLFPRAQWTSATRKVLNEVPPSAFGYRDPLGEPDLRTALARYLARARGVLSRPERLVICAGYAHGISLLADVLHAHGADELAFEDPSLGRFRELAAAAGPRVTGVPVDDHGIVASEVHSPAVVTTPAHQYPLGVTLAPHRRSELIRWVQRSGAFLVEDDYDGEFRFDRKPVGALQALAPERVVYAGTVSKTLAPGLRLAWLVLPGVLVEPVRARLSAAGAHLSVLDQLVLARMLDSGEYDRHVRRCRAVYRSRRDKLLAAIPDGFPATGIAAGLHLVARLPEDGPDERAVLSIAGQHSVEVYSLSPHWMNPTHARQGLVIGYAAVPEHAFGPALDALHHTLRTAQHRRPTGRARTAG